MLCRSPWRKYHKFLSENSQDFPKLSRFKLLIFLNVCSASPRMEQWKQFILFPWFLTLVWNRSANISIFSDFSSKLGAVVVRDLGSLEILLMLLLKFAELLLIANYWIACKMLSASTVAGVRNRGWLVEYGFFGNPEEVSRSGNGFLLEVLSPCEEPRSGLNKLSDGSDRLRIPLQDDGYSGNDPHLVPGFQRLSCGLFRERFWSVSITLGS